MAGQAKRAGNADETSFSLKDGDNSKGGREATMLVTGLVQNNGVPGQNSSVKVTIFGGMNFVDEAFPLLSIIPSKADTPRVKSALYLRMHQIEGCYGYSNRRRFSCMIESSEKGSMTSRILLKYLKFLLELYPDICDENLRRFFFKLDSGPVHSDDEVVSFAKALGIVIYPSLPNATEGTQEMDQLFGFSNQKWRRIDSLYLRKNGEDIMVLLS